MKMSVTIAAGRSVVFVTVPSHSIPVRAWQTFQQAL
jgi:hypothetical protein